MNVKAELDALTQTNAVRMDAQGRVLYNPPRYLIFNVDKHQDAVTLADSWDHRKADADAGLAVVVDLVERKRYFLGEWGPLYIRP